MRGIVSLAAALAALVVLSTPALAAEHVPHSVRAAVDSKDRPDADRMLDADRKPAETLAFTGPKPGQTVAELLPGRGYFTRLFSLIVGAKGHVYAIAPGPRPNAPANAPNMLATAKSIAEDPHFSNVSAVEFNPRADTLGVPAPVDMVWTSRNYHDFHNIPNFDVAAFNKKVFDALKPGGIYIVLDHAAAAGAGTTVTRTLHRIDPEAVKSEVTAAGFKLVAESNVLHNPEDAHTAPVFDASVKGKTDQFILKFEKPRS